MTAEDVAWSHIPDTLASIWVVHARALDAPLELPQHRNNLVVLLFKRVGLR